MAIRFKCSCGALISAPDAAAGKRGRCPKCKTLFLVPTPKPVAVVPLQNDGYDVMDALAQAAASER